MSLLFLVEKRPTEDEAEALSYQLQPIIHQMIASIVPLEHQVPNLFSILPGRALVIVSSISMPHTDKNAFIHNLKGKLFQTIKSSNRKFVLEMRWKLTVTNRLVKIPIEPCLHPSAIYFNITWTFQTLCKATNFYDCLINDYAPRKLHMLLLKCTTTIGNAVLFVQWFLYNQPFRFHI